MENHSVYEKIGQEFENLKKESTSVRMKPAIGSNFFARSLVFDVENSIPTLVLLLLFP